MMMVPGCRPTETHRVGIDADVRLKDPLTNEPFTEVYEVTVGGRKVKKARVINSAYGHLKAALTSAHLYFPYSTEQPNSTPPENH